ncbi:MAG TPA: endonuclease V [Sulfurospirillum arcachonense]|nr:endonuclease V [Sulfurospirillum arcachonense]
MIYVLDVQYNGDSDGLVACIGFTNWDDEKASYAKTHFIEKIEPYEAGAFYKRELPCLLEALKDLDDIECVIVDGYVWLGAVGHDGLGMYLYYALGQEVPIVGVAKTQFSGTPNICEVLRGESLKSLFVTAVDMELEEAKNAVLSMHGKYRIPTLLKEVDGLCRGH